MWKNYFSLLRERKIFLTHTHTQAKSRRSLAEVTVLATLWLLPRLSHCGKLPVACVGAGKQGGEDFLSRGKAFALSSLSLVAGKSVGYEFSDGSVQRRTFSPRSIFKAVKEFSFCVPLRKRAELVTEKSFPHGIRKVCLEAA